MLLRTATASSRQKSSGVSELRARVQRQREREKRGAKQTQQRTIQAQFRNIWGYSEKYTFSTMLYEQTEEQGKQRSNNREIT